ncbi:type II toxin-antitoxin system RelE/ParE family toxin [Myroides marinus]|uniref:type II toxin-antitoxin system RelE/ParE family toxin n=1 Tax=Myroides marinus TaxID=703342 RepID=UPI00257892AC|nr:type II toxin-antitoxin system RelE/ParE family toxin [Myroides marinus]
MTYNIVILPSAIQDLDAIFEYYYSISKQALESFKRQFDKTIKVLKVNPFLQIRYNDIRVISIKKFPYVIFFLESILTNKPYISQQYLTLIKISINILYKKRVSILTPFLPLIK